MTAPATAASTTGTACKHLADQIKLLKATIKKEEDQIERDTARIQALQHKPHPDSKAIHKLQASIQDLEKKLVDDREKLAIVEDEFTMRCGA